MSATGRNIKAIRKDHNLTQSQFAESVGVTTTTVAGWETREVLPHATVLKTIAELYKISVDDIVSVSGYYVKQEECKSE